MFTKEDMRRAIAFVCREVLRLLGYVAWLYLLAFVAVAVLTLAEAPIQVNLLDMAPLLGPAVVISLAAALAQN